MKIAYLQKEPATRKFVLISIFVVVLYTLYNYQGSPHFFLHYFNHTVQPLKAQAFSQYYQWSTAFFLLGIIPAFIVKLFFKERLEDYGLYPKRPLISLLIVVLGILFVTPLTFFGAKSPRFTAMYPLVKNAGQSPYLFFISAFFYFLYYIGYEFFFRGFLFMGTKDIIGDWEAMGVSLMATVLLHIDRPEGEMALAILAGIIFPIIVKKMKTLWPVILIHTYAGISLNYWILINRGGF